MNPQLVIVIFCLLAAVIFIARKILTTFRRKGAPTCGGCPNEKACGKRQAAGLPPCSLEELRPK